MLPPAAAALLGPVVMADFAGTAPSADLFDLIAARRLGGVILFAKNITGPAQAAQLCRGLQEHARRAGRPPLLIAVDQEGGPVERFPLGVPGAMAIGATGSVACAERAGRLAGRMLRTVGATVDFAPVLDVNTNPANPIIGVRSFGEDPQAVARLGRAFVAGLHSEGVAAVGKHFPGHGDTDIDSHLDLPEVAHGLDRLAAVEFLPFRECIRAGLGALMTAHIAIAAFDREIATLSGNLLDGVLRRTWGFRGAVFTDSLSMAAIREGIGAGPAAVSALQAGADMVLALGGPELLAEVFAALHGALERGELTVARLREAQERLARLQSLSRQPDPGDDPGAVAGAPEHARWIREIAESAVTLVRRAPGAVPLPPGPLRVAALVATGEDPSPLGAVLRGHGRQVEEIALGPGDTADWLRNASGPAVLVTRSRGRLPAWQAGTIREAFAALGDRLVVVATGTPYDLTEIPFIATYLATYGREPALLEAAAGVLCGTLAPRGRLPVSLAGLHPVGHGVVW